MTETVKLTPLQCSIRQPIPITLDEGKSDLRSGLSVVEVKFPNVLRAEVGEIYFKNYYTASIVVKVKDKGGMIESVDKKWRTVVRRMQLMPHAHCEGGSQDYFTIKKKQMVSDTDNIISLRFILYQPSPVWKDFRIEQIQLFKTPNQDMSTVSLPPWLSSLPDTEVTATNTEPDDKETPSPKSPNSATVIPNIDNVTLALQQMWALTQKVKVKEKRNMLGRFEVDGSYDINLLSYT